MRSSLNSNHHDAVCLILFILSLSIPYPRPSASLSTPSFPTTL
jgi:hypothetical protein